MTTRSISGEKSNTWAMKGTVLCVGGKFDRRHFLRYFALLPQNKILKKLWAGMWYNRNTVFVVVTAFVFAGAGNEMSLLSQTGPIAFRFLWIAVCGNLSRPLCKTPMCGEAQGMKYTFGSSRATGVASRSAVRPLSPDRDTTTSKRQTYMWNNNLPLPVRNFCHRWFDFL